MLALDDFIRLLDHNPGLRRIELANAGESMLNKALPDILRVAHERNVITTFDQGLNLNHATDEALEALVRYQTEVVRVPIDGITQKTYEAYRRGGDLRKVLSHVQTINRYKARYGSAKPLLRLQFIIFDHNEHELEGAAVLARMLDMELVPRLNWSTSVFAVKDRERVRQVMGYADRDEFFQETGRHYCHHQCLDLWRSPTINWDGKLLGCCRNLWVSYADNVFEGPLEDFVNSEPLRYAREMLLGQQPPRSDIACSQCSVYARMQESGNYITPEKVEAALEKVAATAPLS